ncbi:MAG TPA: hypothetical protein VMZ30_14245 [Pyrinomonadaceae bacterium]|nr:hypothetical protein [Pyrinomonadaceae bacterium]
MRHISTLPAAGCHSDRAGVLATVNGRNITSGNVEDSLRPLIFSVQQQIYSLRKNDVDLKITDVLLHKRNCSIQKRRNL